jgi:hypothetical protein
MTEPQSKYKRHASSNEIIIQYILGSSAFSATNKHYNYLPVQLCMYSFAFLTTLMYMHIAAHRREIEEKVIGGESSLPGLGTA